MTEQLGAKMPEECSEFSKYFEIVKENPKDWDTWVYLLTLVEQQGTIDLIRRTFDFFLASYPFCFGYWKKYADAELAHSSPETCIQVFERGVQAIPLSLDLWVHYLTFYKSYSEATQESIKDLFDRAVLTCGLDWKAQALWDLYISWEEFMGHYVKVFSLYKRVMVLPLEGHISYPPRFYKFFEKHELEDLLSEAELNNLKESLSSELENKTPDEVKAILKESLKERCQEDILQGKKETDLRYPYEESLKRTYFHVKALDEGQIRAWMDYINFEKEQSGEHSVRLNVLFERCVIACALYEDVWFKYAWHCRDDKEKSLRILKKAAEIHLPRRPAVSLALAAFHEGKNDLSSTRSVYESILKQVPVHVETLIRFANFEKRRGNYGAAVSLLETAIASMNPESDECLFLKVFLCDLFVLSDGAPKGREMYESLVEKYDDNEFLFLRFLDFELNLHPKDANYIQNVRNVFQLALKSKLSSKFKREFAHRELHFLDQYSEDFTNFYEVEQYYREQFFYEGFSLRSHDEALFAQPDGSSTKRPHYEGQPLQQPSLSNPQEPPKQLMHQQPAPMAWDPYMQLPPSQFAGGTWPQTSLSPWGSTL
ncbi:pre-mRNA-processing factor 39-like [Zophobas morio]|uniref:pre-mRNA-processing factor 39-like n=1 Tax=Zophobas morio TaxID=2755281 RepID=UPI0030837E96